MAETVKHAAYAALSPALHIPGFGPRLTDALVRSAGATAVILSLRAPSLQFLAHVTPQATPAVTSAVLMELAHYVRPREQGSVLTDWAAENTRLFATDQKLGLKRAREASFDGDNAIRHTAIANYIDLSGRAFRPEFHALTDITHSRFDPVLHSPQTMGSPASGLEPRR